MYCLFEISFSCTTSDSHSTRFCGEGTALIVLVVLVFRTLSLLQMNVYSSVSSSRLNFWGHVYLSSMMSACLLNSSWYSMPSTLLIFVLDTVSATASASQPSVSFLARLFGLLRATRQIQSALAYLCCPGRSSRSILLPAVGCALSVLLIDPACGWQCIFRFFSATFGVDDRAHHTRDCLRVAADTFFGATARPLLLWTAARAALARGTFATIVVTAFVGLAPFPAP